MKIGFKWDEVEDRYIGERLFFKQAQEDLFCIINKDEELIGHLEKIRVGQWMKWCLLLEPSCYLSPGCNDEVREMQRFLGGNNNEKHKPK